MVWIHIGNVFRLSLTGARRSRLSFPEYNVPGSSGLAGLNTSVSSSVHSAFPRMTGSNMNTPAAFFLLILAAKSGVKRISTVELTDTIPEVYPAM